MTRRIVYVSIIVAVVAGAAIAAFRHRQDQASHNAGDARRTMPAAVAGPLERSATGRADLERLAADMETRLAADPSDGAAAATLAQVLLRRGRVEANGGYAIRAEQALKEVLRREPGDYDALKMLGAVYLSQHRFRQAIESATRATRIEPTDAWNFGVLGDAHLELGEYDEAFAALDTMAAMRPDAAAYARIAYAQELQGHLDAALRTMRMAAEATGARDQESLAWHYAQIGNLLLQTGDIAGASREFAHADFVFPGHPYAQIGRARATAARGDSAEALNLYRALLSRTPTAETAVAIAELLTQAGDGAGAEAMYARAEALERDGWRTETPQPANLARILADRGVRIDEAVRLAEDAARSRSDIFTMDALAWAYYRAGRHADALGASLSARRTGTSDRRILAHAAAIDQANSERKAVSTVSYRNR